MGAWGTGIFQDDDAVDAREEFLVALAKLQDLDLATEHVVRASGAWWEAPERDTPFWLGLASAQWRKGWLVPKVLAAALSVIDGEADLNRWTRKGDRARRAAQLASLRTTLLSPMPAPRRYPPIPPTPEAQLQELVVGEVIGRQLSCGRTAVLHVLEVCPIAEWNVLAPAVSLLKWLGKEMPSEQEARTLETLRTPLRPDGMSAFTKLSLAARPALTPHAFIRPGWIVPVGAKVPKSGLTTTACIGRVCTLDEMLEYALQRWWSEPTLAADARPPWLTRGDRS